MSKRINISSGAHWEEIVGYSRAVRVGNIIEVAGTAAADGEKVMFPYQGYEQTQYILMKIQQAIEDAGGSMEDVVRTRIFVTDIDNWEEVGKAHGEIFKDIKPVTTMVEVIALINPEMVVEIEATAIIVLKE
ncbi:RidA family protein [bacterium]|nr:RidA family protein [bacterium]